MATADQPRSGAAAAKRDAAEEKADAKTVSRYIVKEGHTLTLAEPGDDGNVMVIHEAGAEVELTKAEADAMPWAVEPAKAKSKQGTGQVRRLQRQMTALQQQMEALKEENERLKAGDPHRAAAVESIRQRADNWQGRNEPAVNSVPRDVREAFENGGGVSGGAVVPTEDLSTETGFKGAGVTERNRTPGTPSQPSQPPTSGESKTPGDK